MLASRGQRKRWLEAMQVLIGDRKFSEPSWPDLVDGLSPERASRLRERPWGPTAGNPALAGECAVR